MPRGDGTGPNGQGPRTGRGMGGRGQCRRQGNGMYQGRGQNMGKGNGTGPRSKLGTCIKNDKQNQE